MCVRSIEQAHAEKGDLQNWSSSSGRAGAGINEFDAGGEEILTTKLLCRGTSCLDRANKRMARIPQDCESGVSIGSSQ